MSPILKIYNITYNINNLRKTFIFLSFFSLFSLNAFSQPTEEKLISACETFDYQKLVKYLNTYVYDSKRNFRWRVTLQREIVNDFIEEMINVTKTEIDKKNSKIRSEDYYELKIIRKESQISIYRIEKIESSESNFKEVLVKENKLTRAYNTFVSDFKKVYRTKLNSRDLFNKKIYEFYAEKCFLSEGGRTISLRKELNRIIDTKDEKILETWIKSPSIEVQLYAIEGIYALQEKGVKFSPDIMNLISIIAKKEGFAFTCSLGGDFYSSIPKLINSIKEKYIDSPEELMPENSNVQKTNLKSVAASSIQRQNHVKISLIFFTIIAIFLITVLPSFKKNKNRL